MNTEDKIKKYERLLEDYYYLPSKEFDKKYNIEIGFFGGEDDEYYLVEEYKKLFREELEE